MTTLKDSTAEKQRLHWGDAETMRLNHALAWRLAAETVASLLKCADPLAALERMRPLVTHPDVDEGRVSPLLLGLVDGIVAKRACRLAAERGSATLN